MVDPVSVGATVTLVAAAGKVLSLGKKAAVVYDRMDSAGSAITSMSKQTTILSRVFIDEAVLGEIVLPNLMKTMHEWYCAQIVAALHLAQMVDSKRTVQDVMSTVQTGYNGPTRSLAKEAYDHLIGQESLSGVDADKLGLEAAVPNKFVPLADKENNSKPVSNKSEGKNPLQKEIDDIQLKNEHTRVVSDTKSIDAIRSVKVGDNRIGPMGELYEIKLNNPADPKNSITIPIFIQMQPSIIPYQFAARFIDLNVLPSLFQRWTQMSAGEITFWKDFVLNIDLINKRMSSIKNPEASKLFSEFLGTLNKKDVYALADVSGKTGLKQSHNLANSVIVLSEDAVREARVSSGVDLHNAADRKRYFRDTYTMIVAIVDSLHQRVTVYFNGIDGDLNLGYSDLKPKDSKFDPNDFMVALQAFSTNQVGRLR